MPPILSHKQQKIRDYDQGCVVVKACPGSGKTFSVAARIAHLVQTKKIGQGGIAAVSFTNVATDEIKEKLKTDFGISSLKYPHFIGTIDKFINTYIFLPYGHLITGATKRPELVGEPHRSWTKGKGDRTYTRIPPHWNTVCTSANPNGYFDCASFDINDELYPIVSAREFHFSLKKDRYYKKDHTPRKEIQDVIDAKWENFALGYANQSDANYLAWKILEGFPVITATLAKKFGYFIIDEAQDTDAVQMRIIELLQTAGAGNIMLIGDRDQSIFEWNNADPALFDAKYEAWEKIELDENWRSSQRICNFNQSLSSFPRSFAVAPEVAGYDYVPTIMGYTKSDTASMVPILGAFFATCAQHGIAVTKQKVAVLYRGKAMAQYLGMSFTANAYDENPWLAHNYHVKDIILGKFLLERGYFKEGYHKLEKGFFEATYKPADRGYHCTSTLVASYIDQQGFSAYRNMVFAFIKLLPPTSTLTIRHWITAANRNLAAAGSTIVLGCRTENAVVQIAEFFSKELVHDNDQHPFYYGTIHSIKGRTFDATLLLLDKKAGTHSNYDTILRSGPKPEEEEELRTVYVALSRPRKILMLAVPHADVAVWSGKFRAE